MADKKYTIDYKPTTTYKDWLDENEGLIEKHEKDFVTEFLGVQPEDIWQFYELPDFIDELWTLDELGLKYKDIDALDNGVLIGRETLKGIKFVTEQDASPMGVYIKKEDWENFKQECQVFNRLIIGVACDNYKVKKFKTRLDIYKLESTTAMKNNVTFLKYNIMSSQFHDFDKAIRELNLHFSTRN